MGDFVFRQVEVAILWHGTRERERQESAWMGYVKTWKIACFAVFRQSPGVVRRMKDWLGRVR